MLRIRISEEIDVIIQQIEENGKTEYIRNRIADLIIDSLNSVKDSFGYWEKLNLANAISNLKINWFRASLVNLEVALAPAYLRNENFTQRNKELDSYTYEKLMEAVQQCIRRIE
jgi:hypothetical protein